VKMGNNSYYILSNMWGSIVLSLGLLALILITFYTINAQWTEQQKLYTQKNDFIQNMTHELKTPISTLSVALEAVTNFDAANDPIKREEYISIARNEAGKISLLVDKVLSLSVLEESAHSVSLQPINLDLLLNEIVVADFSNSQLATVNYTNHYKNTFILADKEWMHIVVQSILDNAIKYHEGNGCIIRINTKVAASNYIDIEIIDNNTPIPNDIKDKVFEKFFRMPYGNIHNVKGHGLGLYYAKRMMEMMNGKVVLESTSEGNNFIIKCKTTGAG
jgi:two-component system, OmpR family, phosphate regulon sensor histidine kinase PhoR